MRVRRVSGPRSRARDTGLSDGKRGDDGAEGEECFGRGLLVWTKKRRLKKERRPDRDRGKENLYTREYNNNV